VLSIEKETGIGLQEMISRKRGEKLSTARGILVALARECGYQMAELGSVLNRDISVLSRLGNITETGKAAKALQRVRMRLLA